MYIIPSGTLRLTVKWLVCILHGRLPSLPPGKCPVMRGCGGRYSDTGCGAGGRVSESTDSSLDLSSWTVTLIFSRSSSRERSEEREVLEWDGGSINGRPRPRPFAFRGVTSLLTPFPPELVLVLLDSSATSPPSPESSEQKLRSESESERMTLLEAATSAACSSSVPVTGLLPRPRPSPLPVIFLFGFTAQATLLRSV